MKQIEEPISGERALDIAINAAYEDYGPGLSDFDVGGELRGNGWCIDFTHPRRKYRPQGSLHYAIHPMDGSILSRWFYQ